MNYPEIETRAKITLEVGKNIRCIQTYRPVYHKEAQVIEENVYRITAVSKEGLNFEIIDNTGTPRVFTVGDLRFDFTPFTTPAQEQGPSILQEAETLINGDRAAAYGKVSDNFANIAKGWEAIFHTTVTPEQVGLAMAWVKIARQAHKPHRDNLVDLAGYAGCIEKIGKGE